MVVYLVAIHKCRDGQRHVWRVRGTDAQGKLMEGYELPRSCPRCKGRFDVEWADPEDFKAEKREFKSYRDWLKWRNKQTRI